MLRTVAALYVDPLGPYPAMPGVECWDAARDARLYAGPWPVVAHPPCAPWSKLKHMKRPAAHVAADVDCGPYAVGQVRRWGGVLEQPEGSRLWAACDLPGVGGVEDAWGGFSVAVEQVSWGHVARKRTWLYLVGIDTEIVRDGIRTGGTPTHWCSGGRKRSSGSGGLVPPGIKVCSAQQRRRTPVAFAEWLVSLARASSVTHA